MKIAVISPHPDDETLGAGGTLLKYKKQGHKIYWINITDVSETGKWDKQFVEKRKAQIDSICEFYGFEEFYDLKFPPAELEEVEKTELITVIGDCFNKIQPEWIIIPNRSDAHSDHRVVFDSCMACTKSFRYPFVKKITTMEILSETEFGNAEHIFAPNYFVDISAELEEKIEAMKIYDTELGKIPFPRNEEAIKALALLRGGVAGCNYAEAFHIVRWIE